MGSLLKAALIGARGGVAGKIVGVASLVLSRTKVRECCCASPDMTDLKDHIKVDFETGNISIETGEAELENKDKEVEKL